MPMGADSTATARLGAWRRWRIFVRERFPLGAHLTMVAAFLIGNAALALAVTRASANALHLSLASLCTLLIFFRLRVFDAIKDWATDQTVHPDRPLARGLIAPREARTVAFGTAAVEVVLAAACGLPALMVWAGLFGYSLLMYREFFIGTWLRPKMELYAVAHTLISAWMGLFVAAAVTGRALPSLPWLLWLGGLANWCVFNVFEFARKSWAAEEEQPGVDSYSQRLRPWGAALLTLSMVIVACGVALRVLAAPTPARWLAIGLLLFVPGLTALGYAAHPSPAVARLFRGVMAAFIVAYYLALAVCLWSGVGAPHMPLGTLQR